MASSFSFLDEALASTLSAAALEAATAAGADHASCRVEVIRRQVVTLRDAALETSVDDSEFGIGVRVLVNGALGFAGTVAHGVEDAAKAARQAVATARAVARAQRQPMVLAPEISHGLVRWSSPYVIDPTTVSLEEKVALLEGWSRQLLAAPGVAHVTANLLAVVDEKHYADTAGTTAFQRRVRVDPELEATALFEGGFDTMRTTAPPVGRGWEYLANNDGWDWTSEIARLPEYLLEKVKSPSVTAGRYDLVIDPTNLWLTIHESIGHATELDRALGYEAAYAGTSFATPDKLGTMQYGSSIMNVTGDRTAEHGLASIAIDDEGVAGQSFELVTNGVLSGYQLDRTTAAVAGQTRSNGCAYADSPLHVPMQRMANVSLQPAVNGPSTDELISGVERGLYVVGDKSWSIDMQRYNFQFTGQRFMVIENGTLTGQVKDVAYQATTTEFWGSMEAIGGEETYLLAGAFNCGKGQPGQVAAVSHGCPSVLVRNVNILNARAEAGR